MAAPSENIAEGILINRRGRGGHSGTIDSRRTTPSALSKVASQRFLDAQPPLLFQEGNTFRNMEDNSFKLRH